MAKRRGNQVLLSEDEMLKIVDNMSDEELAAEMERVTRKVEASTGYKFVITPHGIVDAMKRGISAARKG